MSYQYPIDITWTKEEIVAVVQFFTFIEKAYEGKVERGALLDNYNRFKEIVPSKAEEKRLFAQFQNESNYSSYHVIKKAREEQTKIFTMK
ncbi:MULTISPECIES: UPF0223 family protein [unclassified Virgibacillus]|uniref:UPF0223 family protein n=1 Tax=unclassified Virgibacillus TaxID=2620237 RepID=UPI0024DE7CD6|nr:UPF0223 family protein [Virgibacillus sp. LDC-1]